MFTVSLLNYPSLSLIYSIHHLINNLMLTLKYSHSAPTRPRILSRNSKLHCTLLFAAVQLQRTERINTFAFVSLSEALGTEHEPFSVFTLVLFLVDSIRLYFFQFFRIQKKLPKSLCTAAVHARVVRVTGTVRFLSLRPGLRRNQASR